MHLFFKSHGLVFLTFSSSLKEFYLSNVPYMSVTSVEKKMTHRPQMWFVGLSVLLMSLGAMFAIMASQVLLLRKTTVVAVYTQINIEDYIRKGRLHNM